MKKTYDIFKLLNINPNLKLLPLLKPPHIAVLDPLAAIQQQFGLINMGGKLWVFVRSFLNARTEQGNLEKFQPSPLSHGKLLIKRFLRAQYPQADAKQIVEELEKSYPEISKTLQAGILVALNAMQKVSDDKLDPDMVEIAVISSADQKLNYFTSIDILNLIKEIKNKEE